MNRIILLSIIPLLLTIHCTRNSTEPVLKPRITNEADVFEFKITDVRLVTQQLRYQWQNTGINATIENWSDIGEGAVTLTLIDAAGQDVFSSDLAQTGVFFSSAGELGNWTVRINLTNVSGTVHFQVRRRI